MTTAGKDATEVLSTQETVQVKFVLSGERERLKKLAKEKLQQAGWTDQLRQDCRDFAARSHHQDLSHQAIVEEVQRNSRSQVPDHIKAELLSEIRKILES